MSSIKSKILILSIILLLPVWVFGENINLREAASFQTRAQTVKKKRRLKKRAFRTYITGRRGGCYYMNGNGNKTYVPRSLCK